MKSGLDLSKFRKIHETATHAVLEHPDGHQIHVAKGALNPKTAAQLSKLAMADGGSVPAAGAASSGNQKANEKEKYAKGGKVEHLAGGGFASPMPPGGIYPSSYDQVQADAMRGGNPAGGIRPPATGPAGDPMMSQAGSPIQSAGQAAPMPTNPTIDIAGLAKASNAPGMNMPGLQDAMAHYMKQYEGAFGQQEAGIRAQAQAEGELGRHEAEAQAADQSMKLLIKQNHEDEYNRLNDEITKGIRDIDAGHIDPDHYLNSKSDFGKVKTAIGLVLGGIGSGMTGQPNAALQFLNNKIDRDILAQRMNMGRKETVLGGYLKQMGNLNDATKMTWAFYNDLYTSELKKQAALMRDPIAKSQAMQLVGEREQQKAQVLGPLAFQRALMGTMQSGQGDPAVMVRMLGQMGIINPKQTEDAMKEIGFSQNHEIQSKVILDAFDNVDKENTLGNRAMHVGYEPASVAQLKTAAMPYLKDAEGRINEQELERTDELIPRPGDRPDKVAAKRQGWVNFLKEKSATPTLQSIGIRPAPAGNTVAKPNRNVIPGYGGR